MAVGAGATMVIVPAGIYGGAELHALLTDHRVTHAFITPAALASVDPEGLPHFSDVVAGGEAVPSDLVQRWAPGRRLYNGYGPTETTIMTNISDPMTVGDPITIGGPIAGVRALVLDSRLNPVPVGVPGELYISGPGVSRAYRARPDLTSVRFVANPYDAQGERMYRTGDVVRWVAVAGTDGQVSYEISYMGRSDQQVKVRGFRIELGEIDAVLAGHPAVDFAVTVGVDGPAGETALAAYLKPKPGATIDARDLGEYAAGFLPKFMVPGSMVFLDHVPLTPMGKLDKRALPAPDFAAGAAQHREPATPMEHAIAAAYADVLGVETVGADDSFFDLGGNSLGATRAIARINEVLGVRLGVRILFEAPVVADLAEAISASPDLDGLPIRPLTPQPRPDRIPLSLAQQRMWFVNRLNPDAADYNIPLGLRLRGRLDESALTAALLDVVERQEILRTVYPDSVQGPYQKVLPADEAAPQLISRTVGSEDELLALCLETATEGFDVTAAPPLRALLIAVGPDDHVVLLVIHHIAADGSSLVPLATDLMSAYTARAAGSAPALRPLAVQYADYAIWQRTVMGSEYDPDSVAAQQIAFWKEHLAGLPELLDIPTDRPRTDKRSVAGGEVRFTIGAELQEQLNAVAKDNDTTLFMVIHAAYAILLSRLSGSGDVAVGTPTAGRNASAIEGLVGMFVNTLVMRSRVDSSASFTSMLAKTKTADLSAFSNADLPFEQVVEALAPVRSRKYAPLVQAMLTMQNIDIPTVTLPGLEVSALESPLRYVKSDLGLSVSESFGTDGRGRGIDAVLDYAVDIFDESTVETMAQRFTSVLTAIATDPAVVVGDIDILTADERRSHDRPRGGAAADGFGSALAELEGESLSDLLETAARINPDGIALSHNGTDVTYGVLHAKSAELVVTLAAVGVSAEAAITVALSTLLPGLLEGESAAGFAEQFSGMLTSVIMESGERSARDATLVRLFDEQVAATPDNRALIDGDTVITYAELDRRANRLARLLIARGVGPEKLVAIALDRTAELVVALLAVVKAGGGYLPIDVSHPAERLQFIFDDASPVLVLMTGNHRAALPADLPQTIELDAPSVADELADTDGSPVTADELSEPLTARNTAYVIYTSGSTGRPKGVVIAHETVVALFRNTQRDFGFDENDVWTMFHSYAFDFSVWELWGPLLHGGALVMVDFTTSRSPHEFRELLVRQRVTVLNQTPSAFYQFAEADRVAESGDLALRYVIFGGEALDLGQLDRWYSRHADTAPVLVNMYGITETTVHVTKIRLDRDFAARATASVVGDAIAGLRVHVLDSRLHPVTTGVAGDLYVSGAQLGRGYLDRQDLTAQRFVADPFGAPGERLYRSGDIARWNTHGQLEYLGRSDSQVQLRGFRVELGEVEAALLRIAGVAAAVALVESADGQGLSTGERLIAYVVPEHGAELGTTEVREAVAGFLTSYMVPDVVMLLDELPLTVNGKLDRAALPRPESSGGDTRHIEPRTESERAVAAVFADIAKAGNVGATDSFFDIGGTSLGATRVAARVATALGTEISVRDIFDHPTVAELAELAASRSGSVSTRPPLVARERPDRIPLSPAQSRMWFINQFDTGSPAYNLPLPLRLSGELDVDALRAAIGDVARRHESLRTTFPDSPDGPHQVIHPADASIADIYREVDVRANTEAIEAELRRHAGTGFDVTAELPIRIVLMRVAETEHLLLMVVHHIAADGASMAPLFADLLRAYEARRSGAAPDFEPLAVHYADYSLWQRELLGDENDPDSLAAQQIDFWRKALAGLPESVDLPTDRQRPATQSLRGAGHRFEVPAPVREALADIARTHDVSMFMVIHAALAVFMERLSGVTDIAVGTPIAGRGEQALDPLVGMFVNTVVLRTEVDTKQTFADLLADVRAADINAMAHGDIPFERLVEVLDVHRSTAHHPMFQVALSFDNNESPELTLPGLRVSPVQAEFDVAKFDLQLSIGDNDEPGAPMRGLFTYATDLFDAASIDAFSDRLVRILSAVAADPAMVVSDINVLGDTESADLMSIRGPAGVEPETLPALLERGVRLNPSGVAVSFRDRTMTYAQLDRLTNRVARRLISAGAGPETVVALGIRRSLASVVGIWSIAKTGAAYLPINVDYPRERVVEMVEDSGALFGLTVAEDAADLPAVLGWHDVDALAAGDGSDAAITDADRTIALRIDHPAYLIYTSGSTGKPKAVVVTHRGLANLSADVREHYDVAPESRFLHVASPSFDTSVGELLAAFTAGAAVIVAPQDVFGGTALSELVAAQQVTHVVMTPTALMTVDPDGLGSVRSVVVGGDICPPELAERWSGALRNAYGPTEATVIVTITGALAAGARVTIGAPLRDVTTRVLDSRMRMVPRGVVGELYLSGPGVARGYHDRPQITAQRFVADPYGESGARLYRTGDLVRYSTASDAAPNSLEYVGRSDFQVKIRGFRVELGEIDRVLDAHPDIDFAVTIGTVGPQGDNVLVSYVLAKANRDLDVEALKRGVGEQLPQHMVPSVVMALDSIPLTPIGKLDRRALPDPVFAVGDRTYTAPRNQIEATLAEVFAEVLGVDEVSIDESFFDLGGNSLSATKVVSRAGAALGGKIGVRELFAAPTVAELAQRLSAEVGVRVQRPPLVARPRPVRIPLSLAQTRMWFLNRFDPDSVAYNIPAAVWLIGDLDLPALRLAIADVAIRHESLRTVYPDSASGPHQVILTPQQATPEIEFFETDEEAVTETMREFVTRGFDVTIAVPVRIGLLRVGPTRHVLAMVIHHVAADGQSVAPFVGDLAMAYAARSQGESPRWTPLAVQYADYSIWQRELLGDEKDPTSLLSVQIEFWKKNLAGAPDQLELPADRPRPPVQSLRGRQYTFSVSADLHRGMADLARTRGASTFMAFHGAFALLLARLSGHTDITVGTPIGGRGESEVEGVIGMFVNTLALRTEIDLGIGFTTLLDAVRGRDAEAFSHADVPFERLVEVLNPVRSTAHHPIFQVGLSFQNMERSSLELPGLTIEPVELPDGVAQFDLQLILSDNYDGDGRPAGLDAVFTYADDLFDGQTVAGFADRFITLVGEIVAEPFTAVGDLQMLTAAQRREVLRGRNNTAVVLSPRTLAGALQQSWRDNSDLVAIEGDNGLAVTFAELESRVNTLARVLIAQGVGPETVVGLAIPRSLDLLVGMYAISVAGGAYLPIDPDHPVDRISFIVDSAQPVMVLVAGERPSGLPDAVEVLDLTALDTTSVSAEPIDDRVRLAPLRPENTAYVIYTSGSTGRPKGVAVPHSAVVNQLNWITSQFRLGNNDAVLLRTQATFDLSVWEFWWAVTAGARLVVADAQGHRDPVYLAGLIERAGVTAVTFVPSLLGAFLSDARPGQLASLRHVLCIGEALTPDVVQRFRQLTAAAGATPSMHNLYGPTEAAVSVTHQPVPATLGSAVPIGRPEWNTQIYVLDTRLQPVPDGVTGELYIAGAQLARGYLGRSDLSSERFVANPFGGNGARMYRTGDLGRWVAVPGETPTLEYAGRSDFQVKVRGFRIELGEIERVLMESPQVQAAVVTVHSDPHAGEQLVAYVVTEVAGHTDTREILAAAAGELPAYMVPALVMRLDELPLNINGKLDRKALPTPVFAGTEGYQPPRTPVEEIVATVFADLVGVDLVGVHDSFFTLGGNSLTATRVVAQVNAAVGSNLAVRDLFVEPTVAGLAQLAERADGGRDRPPLEAGPRPDRIPLSPAQSRMWFINQFDTSSTAYNIPAAIAMSGELDVPALRAAVADVVHRHEILRTRYPDDGDGPRQLIVDVDDLAESDLALDIHDVADESDLHTRLRALIGVGFDVAESIPVRIALLRRDETEHVLVMVVHHISGDGSSVAPLARDIMVAYSARTAGSEPGWSELPVQYADYALWQRAVLGDESDPESLAARQIDYWTGQLDGVPDVIDLPLDRPRPPVQSTAGASYEFALDPDLRDGLQRVAADHRATMFMVCHAALAVLLARSGTTDDVVVGTAIAGRGEPELDDLVGMFVNTLVLRTPVDAGERFSDLLARTRSTDIAAFTHTEVPFERLVEHLAPERETSYAPLFQVALAFQNNEQAVLELPGMRVSALESSTPTTKFDLQLTLADFVDNSGDTGLTAQFTYATALFDPDTIAGLSARFRAIVAAVVADPDALVGDIDLLSADQRVALSPVAGAADVLPRTMIEIFDDAVAANADGVALVSGEESLTYRQLDRLARRQARQLLEHGVKPGTPVALAIGRSIESMIAFWAIVKSGGAVLPIDPNYPAERIENMVADAEVAIGLTTDEIVDRLPQVTKWLPVTTGSVPELAETGADVENMPVTARVSLDDLSYVIFTSGSTGRPKGVGTTHRGLANLIAEMAPRFALTRSSRVLHFASPSFDASIFEIMMAVAAGSTQVIAPPTIFGGADLAGLLAEQGVTHAFVTPAALATVPVDGLDSVEMIAVAGDVCPPELVRRWAPGRSMFNLYGPSEATIWSTSTEAMDPAKPVTIGGPVTGVRALVADSRLQPVPPGVAGELYVAGASVGRGYLGRPDLTAGRFVADPLGAPGSRMYRTGDVVRWKQVSPDRLELEFLGRSDHQVKVRGFRIELGEIDAALGDHPDVDFAVTLGHNHPHTGQTVLVAYVYPRPGRRLAAGDLGSGLAQRLPGHMVPSSITVLDSVPLTPAGKLDRRALPEPVFGGGTDDYRAPGTEMEVALAELFADVLGVDRVGVDDSFFALGGDSIVSIQLVSRARSAGIVFTPRDVFDRRTIAELARVAQVAADAEIRTLAELAGGGVGSVPLTPIMRWLVESRREYREFSQAAFLTLPEDPGADRLTAALGAVLDRHDALRSRMVTDDGPTRLEVGPVGSVDPRSVLTRIEFSGTPGSPEFIRTTQTAAADAIALLDPATGSMVRVIWFDPAEGSPAGVTGRLYILIHHLAVDGVSWRILLPDFAIAWGQSENGGTPQLAEVGTSLRAWATALTGSVEQHGDEIDYWTQIVETEDPVLGVRRIDPDLDTASTIERHDLEFSTEVTRSMLTGVSAAYRGGVNDVLLTALAMAVRAWRSRRGSDTGAVLIDLEGHGREEDAVGGADLSRTVGWFTSMYPLALDLTGIDVDDAFAGGPAAGTAVKAVKEQVLSVPQAGIGFGLLQYSGDERTRPIADYSGAQIGFNYLGRITAGQDNSADAAHDFGWQRAQDGGPLGGAQDAGMVAPAVLGINAVTTDHPDGPRLSASLAYAGGILGRDEVRELGDLWTRAAAALATHGESPAVGGLTPSDVPLVRIGQDDIEAIERDFAAVEDIWSLSPLQMGMLFHAEVAGQHVTDIYTAQIVFELAGAVDTERMRSAVGALIDRNPNLRAGFRHIEDGSPVQFVAAGVDVPWQFIDLSAEHDDDPEAAEREAERLLTEHRSARFDMSAPPLVRVMMLRMGSDDVGRDRYRMSLTNHHILLDGWSAPLLMEQLFVLYATGGDDTHLPRNRSYRDFLVWLAQRDPTAAITSWQHALDGLDSPTLLVADTTPIADGDTMPTEMALDIGARTSSGLADLSRERGITMNTVVQAAWGIVLARTSGSDDVVFGATVSGRPPEVSGVESILGLFINTIPVRIRLGGGETILGLLERIQSEQAGLLEAHHVGLPTISRSVGLPTLFDTLTVFESYPVDRTREQTESGIDGMFIEGAQINDASHYPVTVLAQSDPHLSLTLKYVPALVPRDRAEELARRIVQVLDTIAQASWTPVRELDLLDPDERRTRLETWSGPDQEIPDRTVMSLFADQVAATPHEIAYRDNKTEMTFAEFDALTNRRARALIAQGVGPDRVVGVAMSRGLEQIATIYGILKAGGAYLPLDTESPDERLRAVVTDADVRCVVAGGDLTRRLRSVLPDVTCLDLTSPDLQPADSSAIRESERRGRIHPESLAYVLFTSGSTGRPKGVQITQRALVNQLRWMAAEHDFSADDVVLLKTPFTFDASVWEMFAPALAGARTIVAPPLAHRDVDELIALIDRHHVTIVQFVPSVLGIFAQAALPESVSSLRLVFSGGEALPVSLAEQVAALADTRVINLYGPTEVTVDATSAVAAPGPVVHGHTRRGTDVVPIGAPVWNTRGLVLDRWLRPCVAGAVGELYLSGEQVARGYLGRPALTAERFVPAVYGPPGSVMYRTGDRVRSLADGTLEYVGRVDFQVKIRGLRIELEEIETALGRHHSVDQAAAVIHTDDGRQRLVGYVSPRPGIDVDPVEVREQAARVLAPYMVPETIVVLDEFPRGRSGKIARRELPLPEAVAVTGRAPDTENERLLCQIVAEVVGADSVGADDSFFEIGGDSIMAMQLVSRARSAGLRFTAGDVLELRTVAALAAAATPAADAPALASEDVVAQPRIAPLSPVAVKMLERGGDHRRFVMPMVVNLPVGVTEDNIVATMSAVTDHHDALRSRLDTAARTLVIAPAGSVDVRSLVSRVELSAGARPGEPGYLAALRDSLFEGVDRLDPEAGIMLQFIWIDAGTEAPGRLLIVAHHLVVDAVSWRILVADIATAGSQVSAGGPVHLPDAGTSWTDWVVGQQARAGSRRDELDHWMTVLGADDPALGVRRLDVDTDRVDLQSRTEIEIPADIVEPLLAASGGDVTMADQLVAGLAAAVVGWRRDRGYEIDHALFTLEGHGRQEAVVPGADLSRTVGWFTSMFPTRIDLDGIGIDELYTRSEIADDVLGRTRAAMSAHPERGIGYGMLRYLDDEGSKVLSALPEPQIVFNYIGSVPGSDVPAEVAGAPWFPDVNGPDLGSTDDTEVIARGNRMPAQAEIDIQSMSTFGPQGTVVRAYVTYLPDVLARDDLDELFEHWMLALRALAERATP
ncbi:MAG TPA: non-ribosomal peptide synthase/polyketide synthase [Williamsia sp.]